MTPAVAPWWHPRDGLHRYVSDLLAAELARERHAPVARPHPWPGTLSLEQDLGVDSLELLGLATALAEALHLREAGLEDWLLARRTLADWVDIAERSLAHFSERMTFRTSGSSGAPKPCTHALAALAQEANELARLAGRRGRVLCAVPSHHIYGFLFTVLLPRELGLAPEDVVDIRAHSPAWLARNAQPGDLVVGHPDFWQAVARIVPAWPADVLGVTSTAPCPDAVSGSLAAAGLRLLQVYGSSETAGIGWRAGHGEPYQLFAHWRFAPDAADKLLRRLPDGSQREALCQDRLQRVDMRRFHVGPRHDEAVQVGGVNVFPARVRAVLLQHPLVRDAGVRLMRPDEGSRLKAFVVPEDSVEPRELLAQLQEWIVLQLSPPERPKAIRLGQRLPVSSAGKLADWSVEAASREQRGGESAH